MARSPLTDEQRRLAADPDTLGIAAALAARYARRFPRLADEFESEAGLALVEAARTYDPEAGASWKTHATARINGALMDAHRASNPKGYRRQGVKAGETWEDAPVIASLDARIAGTWQETNLGAMLPADEEPIGWEAEYQDEVAALTKKLPRNYGVPFRSHYTRADCLSRKDAGTAHGLSESRMRQIHSLSLDELRAILAPKEPPMFPEDREHNRDHMGVNGTATAEPDLTPIPSGNCPDCGTPYPTNRRRCYRCHPGGNRLPTTTTAKKTAATDVNAARIALEAASRRKLTADPTPAPIVATPKPPTVLTGPPREREPIVPPVPAMPLVLAEPSRACAALDAVGVILDALAGLTRDEAAKVLAIVARCRNGGEG